MSPDKLLYIISARPKGHGFHVCPSRGNDYAQWWHYPLIPAHWTPQTRVAPRPLPMLHSRRLLLPLLHLGFKIALDSSHCSMCSKRLSSAFQVPESILALVSGTRISKHWVLGPSKSATVLFPSPSASQVKTPTPLRDEVGFSPSRLPCSGREAL